MSMPVDMIIENERRGMVTISDATLAECGFGWRERDGVRVLVCGELERAGFVNGFSTRVGGVSPFPDNALNLAGFDEDTSGNIRENRRRFMAAFPRGLQLSTVWQTHSSTVKRIANAVDAARSEDRADALVSDMQGILLGVKTADCVPILLADEKHGAFAAVHAGWRGTVRSIVAKAVESMCKHYGTEPSDLICAIGPAASSRRYEVGEDVIDAFGAAFVDSDTFFVATRPGHALIDLKLANRRQLIDQGVDEKNIYTAPFCTIEHTDLFFSYRIEKKSYGKTGRLLSVIGRST